VRNHRRQVRGTVPIGTVLAGMAIFAVGVFVPMGLGAGSGTSGDQTYTDATGDSGGRLDLTRVRLSNSGDWLEVRFTTREKTINVGENIFMLLDTDVSGTWDYQFSFRGGGSGRVEYLKYPAPAFDPAPSSLATACCQDFGVTLRIRLSGIDNPARLRFYVGVKEADEPNTWDRVPNSGSLDFTVRESTTTTTTTTPRPTKRRVEVIDSWIRPNAPKAGSKVTVGAKFVYSDNGQPARAGRVACRGSVGPARLVGKPARTGGTGTCAFRLPATSAGKTFRGRVTMTLASGARNYSELVRAVTGVARLELEGPKTNVPEPIAGAQFQTSFKVFLARPGQARRRVNDGEVTCEAVVGGRKLTATISEFLTVQGSSGALCAWPIPASAQGSTLRTKVTVQAVGLSASKRSQFAVR
jgi:hypothetical protein